jgi:hypothetical protein
MSVEVKISFSSVPEMLAFFAASKTLAANQAAVMSSPVELPVPAEPPVGQKRPGRPRKELVTPAQPEVAVDNTGSVVSVAPQSTPPAEDSAGNPVEDAPQVSGNAATQKDASSAPVTIDDARAALTKLNGAKGLEAAKKALENYGASRMADLKEGDYAPFVAYCQAASI